jgi:hypothetical protein
MNLAFASKENGFWACYVKAMKLRLASEDDAMKFRRSGCPIEGHPYDVGYYDSGYDVAWVAPAAVEDEGGSCAMPVLVCRLYEPAPIGYSCSCTVGGGQARGVVQP